MNNPAIRWAYLPYSMHLAGPRAAVQHMIHRKNYGCTHFTHGHDLAGSTSSIDCEGFYRPCAARGRATRRAPARGGAAVRLW